MADVVNSGVICDGCGQMDFKGSRYKCTDCENYDLCENCMDKGITTKTHLSSHNIRKINNTTNKGAIIEAKSEKEFDAMISPDKLVICHFAASWYAAAVSFAPKLADISLQYPTVTFIKADIDSMQNLNKRFALSGPAIFFFRKSEILRQLAGISTWGNPKELETILHYEIQSFGHKKIETQEEEIPDTEGSEASAPKKSKITIKHFPQSTYVINTTGKLDQIQSKILEFNEKVKQEFPGQELDESKISLLKEIISKLDNKTSEFSENSLKIIDQLVNWPPNYRFPALDLYRFFVTNKSAASFYAKNPSILNQIIQNLTDNVSDPNKIMSLRCLGNMFANPSLEVLAMSLFRSVLSGLSALVSSPSKNIQIGIATLLLNFSVLFHQEDDRPKKLQLVDAMAACLGGMSDDETAYRLIIGLGTLIVTDGTLKEGMQIPVEKFVNSGNANLKEVAIELKSLL